MRCYRCGAEIGGSEGALVSWHAVTRTADGRQGQLPEHKARLCEDCYFDFTRLMAFAPAKGGKRGSLADELRAKYGVGGKR